MSSLVFISRLVQGGSGGGKRGGKEGRRKRKEVRYEEDSEPETRRKKETSGVFLTVHEFLKGAGIERVFSLLIIDIFF